MKQNPTNIIKLKINDNTRSQNKAYAIVQAWDLARIFFPENKQQPFVSISLSLSPSPITHYPYIIFTIISHIMVFNFQSSNHDIFQLILKLLTQRLKRILLYLSTHQYNHLYTLLYWCVCIIIFSRNQGQITHRRCV